MTIITFMLLSVALSQACGPVTSKTSTDYDLYRDSFYVDDLDDPASSQDLVYEAYKRHKFIETHWFTGRLGSNNRTEDGTPLTDPPYAFATGQRSVHSFGSNSERWDLKVISRRYQAAALYHSTTSDTFVADSLRGHFLRTLSSSIRSYLPILDKTKKRLVEQEIEVTTIVKKVIADAMRGLDDKIRDVLEKENDTGASCSAVIVTKNHVIVINLGSGRVLAHAKSSSGSSEMLDLTSDDRNRHVKMRQQLFGTVASRKTNAIKPFIEIFSKTMDLPESGDKLELDYVLLESPSIAQAIEPIEVRNRLDISERKHKGDRLSMFTDSLRMIFESVDAEQNKLLRHQNPDNLLIMMALK